jgi:Ca2+-transporting ATPase
MLALNFRSLRYSILKAPPHKWLWIAIAWELALIAALLQFDAIRDAFGIRMPTMGEVALVIGLGFAVMASIELLKAWLATRKPAARGVASSAHG